MKPSTFVALQRALLLVALAACAILVVEYRHAGNPAFCGVESGCFKVRVSGYASVGGLPLPNVGLLGFAGLFALSLLATREPSEGATTPPSMHAAWLRGGCIGAGITALGLLGLQAAVIGAFCVFCVVVDLCAIALGALAGWQWASEARQRARITEVAQSGATSAACAGLCGLAIGLPFVWGAYPVTPPLPPALAERAEPGKLTVLEFMDFECPYCRGFHEPLRAELARHGEAVHFERVMVPFASHRGALPAAQLYVCAPTERREEVAHALYSAPTDTLTREGVLALATKAGLDPKAVATCLDSPDTEARIEADRALHEAVGGSGIPMTVVGSTRVMGNDPVGLAAAFDAERSGSRRTELPPAGLYALVAALAAGVSAITRSGARGVSAPRPAERDS